MWSSAPPILKCLFPPSIPVNLLPNHQILSFGMCTRNNSSKLCNFPRTFRYQPHNIDKPFINLKARRLKNPNPIDRWPNGLRLFNGTCKFSSSCPFSVFDRKIWLIFHSRIVNKFTHICSDYSPGRSDNSLNDPGQWPRSCSSSLVVVASTSRRHCCWSAAATKEIANYSFTTTLRAKLAMKLPRQNVHTH